MFAHTMSETVERVVRFDDISLPVFRLLLQFLYTSSCDFGAETPLECLAEKEGKEETKAKQSASTSIEMAKAVLAAADRYQILELQQLCSDKLADSTTTDNAAELLM